MSNFFLRLLFFIFIILTTSCVSKHFKEYPLIENDSIQIRNYNFSNSTNDFKIIFDRATIDKDFIEISIIETDYYYYGQFFFDENFMKMLKSKAMDIGSSALIYEKERTDFSNYDENFLYFTAIKYQNIEE